MSEYEVIKKIMDSTISEIDKAYYIKMFIKGWYTEKDIKWI